MLHCSEPQHWSDLIPYKFGNQDPLIYLTLILFQTNRGNIIPACMRKLTFILFLSSLAFLPVDLLAQSGVGIRLSLRNDWSVQRMAKISGKGENISSAEYNTSGWLKAVVPSTIMGTLTRNGLYPDVFMGENYRNIEKSQFDDSWWYRKQFDLPENSAGKHVFLNFDGLNYYTNIWFNGRQIASRDSVFGTYRRYEIEVTQWAKDKQNVLAIEIFKAKPGDFNLGFVDWNPRPPDENMGVWREVILHVTGQLATSDVAVQSKLNKSSWDAAELKLSMKLRNLEKTAVRAKLVGKIGETAFTYSFDMAPQETKDLNLGAADIPQLFINHPKLWWCNGMGDPNLYHLTYSVETGGVSNDAGTVEFGIRDIECYTSEEGYKGYKLNGRKVLIRGAGWTDDLFLRDSLQSLETQVQYTKHVNLNTLRFESIWGTTQDIYSLCDRYGILAMVGWSCQWEWDEYLGKVCDDFGGISTEPEMNLAITSYRDQVLWLRNHPSIFVWLVGSDKCPRPELERRYLEMFSEIDDRPCLASAGTRTSEVSGPTGVKMNGPYEYVAPVYWYADKVNGGAFGFNTETGPGPQIPVKESILEMIPADKLWPLNDTWNYHCTHSTQAFNKLDVFNKALFSRYGEASGLDEYIMKSEVQSYEALRPMFESFRANSEHTTGIIQWMLNSAWPSFYWQLYDYSLRPVSAYYAARKSNQPLQLIYDYDRKEIVAINSGTEDITGAKARIRELDPSSRIVSDQSVELSLKAGSTKRLDVKCACGKGFLDLRITDAKEKEIANNFYWLSDVADEFDWEKTYWAYTPMKSYADFSWMNTLGSADVKVNSKLALLNGQKEITLTISNPSEKLAFFVHLNLLDKAGKMIRPVFWDDNYVSILPGETKILHCTADQSLIKPGETSLTISGWNLKARTISIE